MEFMLDAAGKTYLHRVQSKFYVTHFSIVK